MSAILCTDCLSRHQRSATIPAYRSASGLVHSWTRRIAACGARECSVKRERKRVAENGQLFSIRAGDGKVERSYAVQQAAIRALNYGRKPGTLSYQGHARCVCTELQRGLSNEN